MRKTVRVSFQIVLVLLFLGGGAGALKYLTDNKPPLAKKRPKVVVPIARVITAKPSPVTFTVEGEGTVEPLRQTTLSMEVAGKVEFVSPKLVNGGHIKSGEIILRTDVRDYQLNVSMKRAKVLEAQTYLQSTQAESAAAMEEWKSIAGNAKKTPPPLLIKAPQMAEAKAKLAAARSELEKAELDLERTELTAPFDCRVVSKYMDLGQYLKAGEKVADVFDTQAAEVVVYLEDMELAYLRVPGVTSREGDGSKAEVVSQFGGIRQKWTGLVVRAQGTVDERTRLVPVVVRVENPFARMPPLNPGIHVSVSIAGSRLERAFTLPRQALRNGDRVWLIKDNRIVFNPVEVARVQGEEVFITKGLEIGDQVVTSPLKAVTNGMKVRVVQTAGDKG